MQDVPERVERSLTRDHHPIECVVPHDQERADHNVPTNIQMDERRHYHHRSADDPDHFEELHIPLPAEIEGEVYKCQLNDNEPKSTSEEQPGELAFGLSPLLKKDGCAGEEHEHWSAEVCHATHQIQNECRVPRFERIACKIC